MMSGKKLFRRLLYLFSSLIAEIKSNVAVMRLLKLIISPKIKKKIFLACTISLNKVKHFQNIYHQNLCLHHLHHFDQLVFLGKV